MNGQKIWISSAQIAKWGLFLFRTDPTAIARGRKHEGITAFILDMELPGIEVRPIREITGDSLFCEVFFTDVKVPVGDRLGDENNGWLVSMGALGQERVGSAGQAISMANDLRTLLNTAKAENPDALRDPAIRERVARLHTQIEYTRLLIARALSKVLKGEKGWPEVPIAKLQWGYISLWLAGARARRARPHRRAAQGRARRDRRRRVGARLRVAALHDHRCRSHRGPEEHHRRPRPQARALNFSRKRAGAKGARSMFGVAPVHRSATMRAGDRAEQQPVGAVAGRDDHVVVTGERAR